MNGWSRPPTADNYSVSDGWGGGTDRRERWGRLGDKVKEHNHSSPFLGMRPAPTPPGSSWQHAQE